MFLSELLEKLLNPISQKSSTSTSDNTEASGIPHQIGRQYTSMHLSTLSNMFLKKAYWKGPCEGWAHGIQEGTGPTGKHRIRKAPSPFTFVTKAQPGFSQGVLFRDQL